jgi:hypothetical protein
LLGAHSTTRLASSLLINQKVSVSEESMSQSETLRANLSRDGTKELVVPVLTMSRHGNGPRKSIWKRGLPSFASWNNPKWGFFFLLLLLAADIVLAMVAWVIVRLVTG